ncbi:hypothetical protein WNY37_14195 [Henriciella sp. AS95]|uniref:beta strand repeat-containing protein n=1 Tax=Henriciella sp. AS95 TaxID=3135782 RepID=UPI0031755D6F
MTTMCVVLASVAPEATAQQSVPGTTANCPITNGEAVCEGDLEDGVTTSPSDPAYDTLTITNPTTPIAPPGYFGIGVVRNTDTTINISDDVVVNVYDDPNINGVAQGLIAIIDQGADLAVDTGADITANGNGSFALGIDTITLNGDGNLSITNRGDVEASTSFPSAIAIQARQRNSTGSITVDNSGTLTATSGGVGERDYVTAGILAVQESGEGDISVTNTGAITASATTNDTDFNGVAGGIVTNSLGGANATTIVNSGAISATGQATHGIVGFTSNNSATETATLSVENQASGTLAIDGSVNYGILVQTAGTSVDSTALNAADITMANGDSSTGIMLLNRAQTASMSLTNEGDISGEGSSLRGLGIFTFDAPVDGVYDMLVSNTGDITLDTPLGRGISLAATEDDTVLANVTNSGDIAMANTTDENSHGIGLVLEITDPNAAGAQADSTIDLFNSGDITMGSGAGIWVVADSVEAENTGAISMTNGTGILAEEFASLALTNSGAITTTGANSDGIVADASASDDWQVTVTDSGSVTTSGAGSVGVRIAGTTNTYLQTLIDDQTTEVTVNKAQIADRAMNRVTQYISSQAPDDGDGGVTTAATNVVAVTEPPAPAGAFVNESVVVNGTVRSDGGAGAILSEGALRVGAADPGAVIATTGDNAPVISAQGALSLQTSDRLALSSTGDNSPLFQVLGGGNSAAGAVLTDIDASTTGDNSTAFQLDSGGGDSVANFEVYSRDDAAPSTISTTGAGSHAVQFDTTATRSSTFTGQVYDSEVSTSGNGSMAFNLDLGANSSASLVLADSTVTTAGTGSDAVHVGAGDGSDVLLLVEGSTISTTGAGSDAIDIPQLSDGSIGDAIIIDSSISTTGDDARAFVFAEQGGDASSRTPFVADSDFTTEGDGATALLVGANGNASNTTTTLNNVTISTAGSDARGVDHAVFGDSSAVSVTITDTTIETTGAANSGALSLDGTVDNGSAYTIQLVELDFSTQGSASDAIFIGGGSFDGSAFNSIVGDAVLTTEGDDSRGLVIDQFIASDNSISVSVMDNITVSTTGARASGIVLGTSADLAMVDSSSTMTFDNLDITTAGDNALGLQVQGLSAALNGNMIDSDWAMLLQNSAISTSGNNANGAEIFGLGGTLSGSSIALASTDVDVTTTGDGSDGFVVGSIPEVGANETTFTSLALSFGTIATSGENADAIRIGSGWGSPDAEAVRDGGGFSRLATLEISEDVSATGTGSDGLVTDSLINSLTITDTGSLTGDRFAILSQGAGGIETLTNDGTITGDIQLGDQDSTITGSGTFTGNVDLGGGANSLTVEAGGVFNTRDQVLLGAGNVLTINGDVSPGQGGPVQVTSVEGDVVFGSGSRFLVDIDGSADDDALAGMGASDRLAIDGTATLNGGTVTVSSLTPRTGFSSYAEYQILSATDGVTGTFADLDSNLPFLMLSLQHNADDVMLIAERSFFAPDFATAAVTPNQLAVASTFDAIENSATGDLAAVIDQLIFTNPGQALAAFDTSSGEVYAAMLAQAGANGAVLSRQSLARSHRKFAPGWGAWATATGSDGSIDTDGNGAAIEHGSYGFDVGADYGAADGRWVAGVAVGYRSGDVTLDPRLSDADYEDRYISAYGRFGTAGVGLTATASATLSETDVDFARRIVVGNFSRRAFADSTIDTQSVAGEARYGFAAGDGLAIGPVVSAYHTNADLGGFRERGADSLNLVSSGSSDKQTSFGGGLFANWQADGNLLDLSIQYVESASNSTSTVFALSGAPDSRFNIRAPENDAGGVLGSVTGSMALGNNWTVGLQVDGLAGETVSNLSGSLVVGRKF